MENPSSLDATLAVRTSAEVVQDNVDGTSAESVMSLLFLTPHSDQSDTRTPFLSCSPSVVTDTCEQVRRSVSVGNGASSPSEAQKRVRADMASVDLWRSRQRLAESPAAAR